MSKVPIYNLDDDQVRKSWPKLYQVFIKGSEHKIKEPEESGYQYFMRVRKQLKLKLSAPVQQGVGKLP